MGTKIDTVTARLTLKARHAPYWHKIRAECHLGYRKTTPESTGSWLARCRSPDGKYQVRSFGPLEDTLGATRFDEASRLAGEWFKHLERGGTAKTKTVKDVCIAYVAHLEGTKTKHAAADAERRFNNYVLDNIRLAQTEITKLTPAIVDSWRKSLANRPALSGSNRGGKRTPSSLNRDMTPFRAALNLAFEEGWVTSDFAWRSKLKPLADADKKRDLYLDKDQRTKFISAAGPDLAMFLRGLAMMPVRPGALASLTVGDFDERLMSLRIKTDKTGMRTIKLPRSTLELFISSAKGKLPSAPLFTRADGVAWTKDSWKAPVKAAAIAAKMPEGTTTYTMRHSVISDIVHGGLDLLTVAQISGTSVRMIEKHYGHLRGDIAANALAALAL